MAASIFISYRREDSAGEAGRLADHLVKRFGGDRVFMDIDTIKPGTDFVVALKEALDTTSVVLVVIGRRWLSASNSAGRRLDDPDDFVRREIEAALVRNARVIPVLVQNASMPAESDLPAALAPFATRQAISIQHEEFTDDTQRLIDSIAPLLGTVADAPATPRRVSRGLLLAGAAITALAVIGVISMQRRAASSARGVIAAADSAKAVRQRIVDDLITVASEQRDRLQLVDAASTLDSAVRIDADLTRAKRLQEDVAMQAIRDLTVTGGQTFTQAMAKPLAVLDRAAPFATGERKGDLLAHVAWAMVLRWRDGDRALQPGDAFRRALAADPKNPYANVMLGHWILSYERTPDALVRAVEHFRKAVEAGRSVEQVRRYQMAALKNDGSPPSRLETIRVLQDMRTRREQLTPGMTRDAWSIYFFALNGQASQTIDDLLAVLPPAEHLQTYKWAFTTYTAQGGGSAVQFRFYLARFRAEMGEQASALDSLRVLSKELRDQPGMLKTAVDSAVSRLTRR